MMMGLVVHGSFLRDRLPKRRTVESCRQELEQLLKNLKLRRILEISRS